MELKKLFTAPNVVPCDLLRSLLDARGIPCIVKNELGSAMAGYGLPLPGNPSLPWAWPEVWVHADDYEAAWELMAANEIAPGEESLPPP
jgi:hypothetical protein